MRTPNRWVALALISTTFVSQTIVWYSIIPLFPSIQADLGLTLLQTGSIFSAFMLGFAFLHVPSGFFCQRYGIRAGLYVGMALELITAVLTVFATNYSSLLVIRFACGVGSSLFDGAALAFVAAWFRNRGNELPVAYGWTTGVAYALGSSAGLYVWGILNKFLDWRYATLLAAATVFITLLVFIAYYPMSPSERSELRVSRDEPAKSSAKSALRSAKIVLTNGRLWFVSIAMFGIYGSALAAAAMLPQFAERTLHVSANAGNALGAILLLCGIVGTFIGAVLVAKLGTKLGFFVSGVALTCGLAAIPFSTYAALQIEAAVIGCALFSAYTIWISIPGFMTKELGISDIATAVGLMMTIAAIGPVIMPVLYSALHETVNPRAGWIGLAVIALLFSVMIFWSKVETHPVNGA